MDALEGSYRGWTGGLYGDGSNEPTAALAREANRRGETIQPLDRDGLPSPGGTIGFLTIGPSTTMLQSQAFLEIVRASPDVAPNVAVVNGAENEMTAQRWAAEGHPWNVAASRLAQARVAPSQVQVLWIKAEMAGASRYGSLSSTARNYAEFLTRILNRAIQTYPNLQIAYVSSDTFSGYSRRHVLSEPASYESAFGVRTLIDRQRTGDPALNNDPARGPVRAPLVLWGPYLWADGDRPRRDGLTWLPQDYFGRDGVHPTVSGSYKTADLLFGFLRSAPSARGWFLK